MKDYKKYLNQDPDKEKGAVLIEILEKDQLVSKINTTSKKVSIKHYPNNYMNYVGLDENQHKRYPLYYRVIFNKQSVKIKSNIVRAYSKSEFELEKLSKEDIKYIRREALVLTYIVADTYNKSIHQALRETDEDKASIEKSFDINTLFHQFSIRDYELPKIIEDKLLEMILSQAEHESYNNEVFNLFKYSTELNAYHLLQFLKLKDKIKWEDFEKGFHPKIWFFSFYYYDFINTYKEYEYVGVTALDLEFQYLETFTESDYFTFPLSFENKFYEFFLEKEFFGLINQIKKLLNLD